jgi:hypothetical protein
MATSSGLPRTELIAPQQLPESNCLQAIASRQLIVVEVAAADASWPELVRAQVWWDAGRFAHTCSHHGLLEC